MNLPEPDLTRPSANADSWGRYYTADWVSQDLINAIRGIRPKSIIELGAGRGALAGAAGRKWKRAEVITVDLDDSIDPTSQTSRGRPAGFIHHVHDALDDQLGSRIGVPLNSVDVAVCNPPYVRPRWRESFGNILEDAGLSGTLNTIHDAGADLLFIAQNLRFLKRFGKLGLILPDGLITAEKYAGVRRTLLKDHFVEQVIQLPRRAFSKTEAQTYLVVLAKKNGETDRVTLRKISAEGVISPPLYIPPDLGQHRLDFSFHETNTFAKRQGGSHRKSTIREIIDSVVRGSFSTNQIRDCIWPVFHLGDFGSVGSPVPARFKLSRRTLTELPRFAKLALPGDILVARVGRNLQDKVALVTHGPCVISDCVFALRPKADCLDVLFKFLTSETGRAALTASAQGVGARFISSSNLQDLEIR